MLWQICSSLFKHIFWCYSKSRDHAVYRKIYTKSLESLSVGIHKGFWAEHCQHVPLLYPVSLEYIFTVICLPVRGFQTEIFYVNVHRLNKCHYIAQYCTQLFKPIIQSFLQCIVGHSCVWCVDYSKMAKTIEVNPAESEDIHTLIGLTGAQSGVFEH